MTVTRFVRGLGFENLRDLKKRLRVAVADKDSEVDDYMARFQCAKADSRCCRKACGWNSTLS
ncbi:hypothetical protein ACOJBM_41205 [Rhizobium beringeri]